MVKIIAAGGELTSSPAAILEWRLINAITRRDGVEASINHARFLA